VLVRSSACAAENPSCRRWMRVRAAKASTRKRTAADTPASRAHHEPSAGARKSLSFTRPIKGLVSPLLFLSQSGIQHLARMPSSED
jgi:hypothetical protein